MTRIAKALSLIWVITCQKFLPRTQRESAKMFWLFAEPAGQLTVLIIIFTFIGRTPAYGTSMALFLLTGIVMLNFFSVGSNMVMGAVLQTSNKLRLGPEGIFHNAIATVLFKFITAIGYTVILLIGVWYFQEIDVFPKHPFVAFQAMLWCFLLCIGVGFLRALATKFLPVVERVYAIMARALLFVSGVFYVPSFMPPQIRDYLLYNPVLQLIEHFRLGMYDQYPTIVFSSTYLQIISIGTTAVGAALIWYKRSKFLE